VQLAGDWDKAHARVVDALDALGDVAAVVAASMFSSARSCFSCLHTWHINSHTTRHM
jgi:hypothetical protein